MSYHIRRKKIHFAAAAFVLIFLITGGIDIFKGKDVWSLVAPLRYLTVRAAYAKDGGEGTVGSALAAIKGAPVVASATETADALPVLLYHGIVQKADRFAITQDAFRDQMFALKRAGYQTVSTADFEAFMRGQKTLPKKSFLLTFDDGRLDSYHGADPILQALGFHAVMFVAVEDSMPQDWKKRQTFYINKTDIQHMAASGRWEIESHALQLTAGFVPIDAAGTQGNFLSNRAWLKDEGRLETDAEFASRIDIELTKAKTELSDTVSLPVESFAYPFGDYGQQTVNDPNAIAAVRAIISKDYAMAFRQVWLNDGFFAYNRPGDDMYDLKRIETPTDWTGAQLLTYLAQGETKALPYHDDFSSDQGWMLIWGKQQFVSGGLELASDATTTGTTTMLEGTRAWTDYAIDALVEWQKNGYFSLASRYQNTDDHVSCVFGGGWVRLDRTFEGKTIHLAEKRLALSGYSEVTMQVKGAQASCGFGGKTLVSAPIQPGTGGVALKIWDATPDNAQFVVKRLEITPLQ